MRNSRTEEVSTWCDAFMCKHSLTKHRFFRWLIKIKQESGEYVSSNEDDKGNMNLHICSDGDMIHIYCVPERDGWFCKV